MRCSLPLLFSARSNRRNETQQPLTHTAAASATSHRLCSTNRHEMTRMAFDSTVAATRFAPLEETPQAKASISLPDHNDRLPVPSGEPAMCQTRLSVSASVKRVPFSQVN